MVSITSTTTITWSTGYNGRLTIKNNSTINYSSNWKIICTLPTGSSINWADNLEISSNLSGKITLLPKSYTPLLNSNSIIECNFGGMGNISTIFEFVSTKPTPTPIPPTPIPPTPIPPTPIPPIGINYQKRVVYLGYWFKDSDIQTLVSSLKSANITHLLLTFIVQPDNTKPLTGTNYMLDAFKSLSPTNQDLLRNNFKIGVSLGGAINMPVPYSNTFIPSNSYYFNNPQKYAQDYYNLVKPLGLHKYFDLDIEGINDKFTECSSFLGELCKELKKLNPSCQISHAPQPPYFCSQFGNVYKLIYQNYNQYFDWFNIQYYNNGPSQTFEQIFITSDVSAAPNTSILELINSGIKASYLVVGKVVQGEATADGGYIPLPILTSIIEQAFRTPSLTEWSKNGGEMIWYFNTGDLNTDNNKQLLNYFTCISKF